MNKQAISEQVKKKADEIVKTFNETVIKNPDRYYVTRYKGSYLHIDRLDHNSISCVCRLKYTGNMDEWEFAIFKYSDESYDAEDWFFPGSGHVDGTIKGALKAGLEAYP